MPEQTDQTQPTKPVNAEQAVQGASLNDWDDDADVSAIPTVNSDGQTIPIPIPDNAQEINPDAPDTPPAPPQQPETTTEQTQTTAQQPETPPEAPPADVSSIMDAARSRRELGFHAAEEREIQAARAEHKAAVMQQELNAVKAQQAEDYDPDKPPQQETLPPIDEKISEIRIQHASSRIHRHAEDAGPAAEESLKRMLDDKSFPMTKELLGIVSHSSQPMQVLEHLDKNRSLAFELNRNAADSGQLVIQQVAEIAARSQNRQTGTVQLRTADTREELPNAAPRTDEPSDEDHKTDQTAAYDKYSKEQEDDMSNNIFATGSWS